MSETRDICNRCGGTGAFLAAPLPLSGIRAWEPCPACSEEAEISRLQSRIEELERALKPFADAWERFDASMDIMDNDWLKAEVADGLTWGDLRQARSTLEASNKGGK